MDPKHKSAIWDRTPPTYTSNLVYMCAEGFRGPKSSNRIGLSRFFQELLSFFKFGFPQLWGGGVGGCGVSRVNNYSLYEFRSVQR